MCIYFYHCPLNFENSLVLKENDFDKYYKKFDEAKKCSLIPIFDLEEMEEIFGCQSMKGWIISINGLTGDVYPCERFPVVIKNANVYKNMQRGILQKILFMPFFIDYRARKPCFSKCHLEMINKLEFILRRENQEIINKEEVITYIKNLKEVML